jgi:hypothetical protein
MFTLCTLNFLAFMQRYLMKKGNPYKMPDIHTLDVMNCLFMQLEICFRGEDFSLEYFSVLKIEIIQAGGELCQAQVKLGWRASPLAMIQTKIGTYTFIKDHSKKIMASQV